ncbi:sodium:solute symporter [Sandaracinomonas limnophila]|uniref:Sodium:solute symporter n=1 Tax=Sandaracinomonas limnophila TaxID=1862386 RepID=A0A437PR57_9BACT|nr:sodium:solute symporter [Sandaracinomonas limnophila]RVU24727.1 sodium:solute symporter [Sandaracinomonas limnophila]
MKTLDWIILFLTIGGIVAYGAWKGRQTKHSLQGFLLADRELPWYHILFSVMATQASAITFLSAPGQAYTDGMRFVQFYLGLPLAMIVLSTTFIPNFFQYKVYTAYQILEERFDAKTRILTSILFLIPRALSTGVTIAAPSIILSSLLGWDLSTTNIITALVVTAYCVLGGSKAISYTQMLQMSVVLLGMILAAVFIIYQLPEEVGLNESLHLAGKMGKMNLIDWKFDLNNRYNIWSGIIGGFFLQLSYFGTDQSQVGRYLTAKNTSESKLGLLMNGFIKIPMQFFILLVGLLVFTFYQFNEPPLFFNQNLEKTWKEIPAAQELIVEKKQLFTEKKNLELALVKNYQTTGNLPQEQSQKLAELYGKEKKIKENAIEIIKNKYPEKDTQDSNYIFLTFIINHLPIGIVGFLIAMILLSSMGSMASAFGSLTSTTMVDIYQRFWVTNKGNQHYWWASKWMTIIWGLFCLVVAQYANNMGSLIEVVNILGSWFYGTILGVFLCAFYLPKTNGNSVFYAAILAEAAVIYLWKIDAMAFLWLNVVGCLLVLLLATVFSKITEQL